MKEKITSIYLPLVVLAAPKLDVDLPGSVQQGGTSEAASNSALTSILDKVYLVAGIAAVIAIIVGGFWYVTSNGEADKIKRGKNAIIYASIGLVFILLAFGITGFISGRIQL